MQPSLGCFSLIGVGSYAHANWLVDEARWHVSAHGQTACLDCHGDKSNLGVHPDPGVVNRSRKDFYRAEQCEACHEQVWSELKSGTHAGKPLRTGQDYSDCIDCHDPHYQLQAGDSSSRYNPGVPVREQCSACHERRDHLPQLDPANEACMVCHRWRDARDPSAAKHSRTLCLTCHTPGSRAAGGAELRRPPVPDMGPEGFMPHRELACLACHPQAAQFGHSRQVAADCRHCHVRHDEAVAHDAHLSVSCGACHLKQVTPYKDRATGIVGWARQAQTDTASRIHNMVFSKEQASCRRCHHSANPLGAAAMVLPAKSILCMPCHAATFSAGDPITILTLIVFAAGLVVSLSYWFSGSLPGVSAEGFFHKGIWIIREVTKTVFAFGIFSILKILVLDGSAAAQILPAVAFTLADPRFDGVAVFSPVPLGHCGPHGFPVGTRQGLAVGDAGQEPRGARHVLRCDRPDDHRWRGRCHASQSVQPVRETSGDAAA